MFIHVYPCLSMFIHVSPTNKVTPIIVFMTKQNVGHIFHLPQCRCGIDFGFYHVWPIEIARVFVYLMSYVFMKMDELQKNSRFSSKKHGFLQRNHGFLQTKHGFWSMNRSFSIKVQLMGSTGPRSSNKTAVSTIHFYSSYDFGSISGYHLLPVFWPSINRSRKHPLVI